MTRNMEPAVTVMDGGMGRELIRRGVASSKGLWSAQALLDAPQVVVEAHRDYIAAGARIITTNSYSCVPSYLGKADRADSFVELGALAGRLARTAASDADCGVLVAGGLPPLAESYRSDLVVDDATARPIYAALAEAPRTVCGCLPLRNDVEHPRGPKRHRSGAGSWYSAQSSCLRVLDSERATGNWSA